MCIKGGMEATGDMRAFGVGSRNIIIGDYKKTVKMRDKFFIFVVMP